MSHHDHKGQSPKSVDCAVVTVSDSRTEDTDESGRLLKDRLISNGHRVLFYALLKNDASAIRRTADELIARSDIQVVVTTGGTGVSQRDVTVETLSPILDKKFDGFGELFRFLTYQDIGTTSVMSRAMAGVARGKVIICLPGSLAAVKLAADGIILPEVGHMVREATR